MDRPNLFYRLSRMALYTFYKLVFRVKIIDSGNVPASGGVMLCANHTSYGDPLTIGIGLKRPVRYMAKAELFSYPVVGPVIRAWGAFPVKRGAVSKDAIRQSIRLMQEGRMVGIFPEGTRNKEAVGSAKRGAAIMGIRAGAMMVPTAIIGNYKWFRRMTIIYGRPINAAEYENGREDELTEAIMVQIRALIKQYS